MRCPIYYTSLLWLNISLQSCGSLGLEVTDEKPRGTVASNSASSESLAKGLGDLGIEQASDGSGDSTKVVGTSMSALPTTLGNRDAESTGLQRDRGVVPPCHLRTQIVEDVQMASVPCSTIFSTPEAAQEAVSGYLARWQLETSSGRGALREYGRSILKGVEKLKKATKHSYRKQVLGFEAQDIDPLVWRRVLQAQRTTQSQLRALRGLRTQLLDTLQLSSQDMKVAELRVVEDITGGVAELYSSDEEEQQISDQSRRNHAAFVVGVGKVLKKHLEKELLALLDNAMGTKMISYATFSSTPELPELLKEYIQQEIDKKKRAELLGSLLTEAILRYFSLSKANKRQLNKIKHELGQAAHQVILHYGAVQDTSKAKSTSRYNQGPQT